MMEKLFQHNGWLKVFSVALAILLWAVVVVPSYTAENSRTFDISLTVVPHPAFRVLEGGPDERGTVQVRADGKNVVIQRLKKEHFQAVVDYSKITEPGKSTQVEVQLIVDEQFKNQANFTVTPPTYLVTLVELKKGTFPVFIENPTGTVTYQGKEWSYTAEAAVREAEVTGRGDLLNLVSRGRVALDKPDLIPTTTEVEKSVTPVDANGKSIDKLTAESVRVTLRWEQLPEGKPFKVAPVTRGNLPAGYVVSGFVVDPPQVTVRAASLEGKLPPSELIETAPIDLTGKNRSFTATVRLVAPSGTRIGAETVNVTVNIAEVSVEKIFRGVPLTVRGQASNAEVLLGVSEVQVTLKGPHSVMNPLDAGSFSVFVDVEGVQPGKHMLPVKVLQPAGVTEMVVDPAMVEVTINVQ